ncbi:DUF5067 domain-containing protein [Candidatus Enterococcus mangumiae]|uniref:DUF5067 domain-containing protein n=1 Tax=Candidatus Enterococcus mangumiae TaxID=2230878 RepID=A0ABZ2T088_9ENTE|nr:DUF5067 domain-containing protein [Enterococcus sp. DIV1094]MBO0491159.1 DUF5067 domain-containing protein [Enterococcus sp. DIV1094]
MKKIVTLGFILISSITLGACNNNDSNSSSNNSSSSDIIFESSSTSDETETRTASDTTFEDDSSKIVIKNTEELTSQYDVNKKILAMEIEYTNKGDEAQSPWFAFATSIRAIQETDTTEEILNGANGLFAEDYKPDLVKMGDTNVKSGATVDAVIGLVILYPGSPITMQDVMANGVFEKTIETTN